MSIALITVLIITLLFVLFFLGVEIGLAMAIAGFIGYAIVANLNAALHLVATDVWTIFSSYGYIVIFLFVIMGQIATQSGVSKGLYNATHKFIGHIPGGLAIGTVVAATVFKAICGSAVATSAAFATIAVPEMDRYRYDRKLSGGTVATVGSLGAIIPPSTALIIYGLVTETSIGKLFLAGIIPGLMVAFSFVITLLCWCKINPKLGPKSEKSTWKERFSSLPQIIWVLLIFGLVVGGLMQGWFTPTEAGSAGVFAVFLLVFVKGDIGLKGYIRAVKDSLHIGAMVMVLLLGATILGHFFAATKTPYVVAEWLGSFPVHPKIIIAIIVLVYLIGGSFIEDLAFLVLATPIFLPLILKLGFDPVWFGIVICVTTMIGIIIPPMAVNVFVVAGILKMPLGDVYKGIYPYLAGMTICLILILLFPQIALWLPGTLMK